MAVLPATELRTGMVLRLEGEIYKVVSADYHAGGGKMAGVTHAKLRNLTTGAIWERRFRPDERVEEAELERQTMQFLYADGEVSNFMNPESFEQLAIPNQRLGAVARYLKPEMTLPVQFFEGQAVGVVFPPVVELRVAATPPPAHSPGSDNVWKEATLENGLVIQVPPFIAPGERVRVEVETATYLERAKAEKKK